MSIAIAPLTGIALGPLAIVAVVFGAFVDLAIAPYTTMVGIFDPLVLGVSALAAGLLMIPSVILCLITFPYLRVWIRSENEI